MVKTYKNDSLVTNGLGGLLRRSELDGSRADLLLDVLHDASCIPRTTIATHIVPSILYDLDGGVRMYLVLVLDLLVPFVVRVHLRKHHWRVMLPQNSGCLLVLLMDI